MKIVRDNEGRIVQVIKEESDGDVNVIDVFKAEIDKEIAKEKEITEREKEKTNREEKRCNFFLGCTSVAAKAIIAGIDEYNRQQQNGGAYNGLNTSKDNGPFSY